MDIDGDLVQESGHVVDMTGKPDRRTCKFCSATAQLVGIFLFAKKRRTRDYKLSPGVARCDSTDSRSKHMLSLDGSKPGDHGNSLRMARAVSAILGRINAVGDNADLIIRHRGQAIRNAS